MGVQCAGTVCAVCAAVGPQFAALFHFGVDLDLAVAGPANVLHHLWNVGAEILVRLGDVCVPNESQSKLDLSQLRQVHEQEQAVHLALDGVSLEWPGMRLPIGDSSNLAAGHQVDHIQSPAVGRLRSVGIDSPDWIDGLRLAVMVECIGRLEVTVEPAQDLDGEQVLPVNG